MNSPETPATPADNAPHGPAGPCILLVCLIAWGCLPAQAAVLRIELPPETASFKPAPGADLANGQCLTCHSVDYVVMQPPLPRTFWVASVKKMSEKYGAPVPEDQVETLVNYLTRNYGVETNSGPGAVAAPVAKEASLALNAGILSGEALATQYGCLGCHQVRAKLVGPAYKEIASKYQNDPEAFAKISEQIHKGGSGKWGPVLMPPFPAVNEPQTKALAEWILSRK
jgi:cytochrome c551/c552